MVINEKQNQKMIIKHKLVALTKDNKQQKFSLINICKSQVDFKVIVNKRCYINFKILEKLKSYNKKYLIYIIIRGICLGKKRYQ